MSHGWIRPHYLSVLFMTIEQFLENTEKESVHLPECIYCRESGFDSNCRQIPIVLMTVHCHPLYWHMYPILFHTTSSSLHFVCYTHPRCTSKIHIFSSRKRIFFFRQDMKNGENIIF